MAMAAPLAGERGEPLHLARMPAFVPGDDGERIQSLVAMVMVASGRIRATALGHPERPAEALEKALREAMHHPPDKPSARATVAGGGARRAGAGGIASPVGGCGDRGRAHATA